MLAAKAGRAGEAGQASRELLADVERRALAAADAWATDATSFLDGEAADAIEAELAPRADVSARRLGGYAGAHRSLFVLTHPELADAVDAAAHVALYRIDAGPGVAEALVPALAAIGLGLDQLGDIRLNADGAAYVAVSAGSAKQLERLLPKELRAASGDAVSIQAVDAAALEPGKLVAFELHRLDKRAQKALAR